MSSLTKVQRVPFQGPWGAAWAAMYFEANASRWEEILLEEYAIVLPEAPETRGPFFAAGVPSNPARTA